MRFVARRRGLRESAAEDEDPLAGLANLFDVSVAFIVALLVALFGLFSSGRLLDPASDVTVMVRSASGETQLIRKKGAAITVQKVTDRSMSGEGTRLGTAYRLANGQVVYVPESDAPAKAGAP
jgi:hypothetical protein